MVITSAVLGMNTCIYYVHENKLARSSWQQLQGLLRCGNEQDLELHSRESQCDGNEMVLDSVRCYYFQGMSLEIYCS